MVTLVSQRWVQFGVVAVAVCEPAELYYVLAYRLYKYLKFRSIKTEQDSFIELVPCKKAFIEEKNLEHKSYQIVFCLKLEDSLQVLPNSNHL